MMLTGSCHCGAVRFQAQGTPYRVGICHCLDCRKKSGSLFNAFAIYPADSIELTGATTSHTVRNGYRRHVCAACASPIYEARDGSDERELFVGTLDEPDRLTPTYELWTIRRESWLPEFPLARHHVRDREGTGRTEP